jgi:peptidoglycan/LPS O-acetylase OafA/YrhL
VAQEVKPLTGLRWFAAFGVFIYHFGNPSWFPNSLKNIQLNGAFGVQFFFVLSGYVLATRYRGRPLEAIPYALARFARIGPMYYVGLLLSIAYYLTRVVPIDVKQLVVHGLGLQAWNGEMDNAVSLNGPAWTISVELLFYSVFPLLIKPISRFATSVTRSVAVLALGTVLGGILIGLHCIRFGELKIDSYGIPNEFVWFSLIPIYYLGLFIAGIGAAHLTQAGKEPQAHPLLHKILRPSVTTSLIMASILTVNFDSPEHPYVAIFVRFSFAALPVGLMLSSLHLHPESPVSKILSIRPLNFLGKVSYAFYILHVPFIWLLRLRLPDVNYETQFLLLVMTASLSYVLIEQPLRKALLKLSPNKSQ